MAPKVSDFVGLGGVSPVTDGKRSTIRALPSSWYLSEDMYELERRAIFTSKWMLITHQQRFTNPGDWVKFECAGYEFIIARDRKGNINAFHNTCRHRAYSVVPGKSGNNRIFSCKYHGWSYGLDGKLAKAPRFDDMEGFDRSQNGLFKIHTRIDDKGFIWVNLDSSDNPEPWEKDFANIDMQERYNGYNFSDYIFDHEWQMDDVINWKLCSDNYNECYHCPTSHPTIPTLVDIETIKSEANYGWIKHTSDQTEEQKREGLLICATYHYPNVNANVLPHFMMIQRFVPHSAQSSTMHYQIFRNKTSSQESFNLINNLYKQVMSEDKALCAVAHSNIARGVYVNGEMHPRLESASLYVQAKIREDVKAHLAKEKAAGHQLWPARQKPNADQASKEDEDFCASLACQPTAW